MRCWLALRNNHNSTGNVGIYRIGFSLQSPTMRDALQAALVWLSRSVKIQTLTPCNATPKVSRKSVLRRCHFREWIRRYGRGSLDSHFSWSYSLPLYSRFFSNMFWEEKNIYVVVQMDLPKTGCHYTCYSFLFRYFSKNVVQSIWRAGQRNSSSVANAWSLEWHHYGTTIRLHQNKTWPPMYHCACFELCTITEKELWSHGKKLKTPELEARHWCIV